MDTAALEKNIDIGADVVGADGKKLGKVAYVVVKPPEMQLTDIVVDTGLILGREVVVPVGVIRDVEGGKVQLSIGKDELEDYPDYIEVNYQVPPPNWVPPVDFTYPPATVLLPPTATLPELETVRINAPPGTRGIRDGMDVYTSDGQKVGSVDAVDVDLATDEITGFVVKHGFIFTRDTRIPAKDVREIRDGRVILRLSKDQIERVEREQRD